MSRLDKIDKLLRLYESDPDSHEGQAALRKGARIMRGYIDNPNSESRLLLARLEEREKELNEKEKDLEKICRFCGGEKPEHHVRCSYGKFQKRLILFAQTSCLSCTGVLLCGFIFAAYSLYQVMT